MTSIIRGLTSGNLTLDQIYAKAALGTAGPGVASIRKVGTSGRVDADETKHIWPYETDRLKLSSAETMSIVSSSDEDKIGGSGSAAMLVLGLDDNYDPIQETVILNGLTPVSTAKSYKRINSLIAIDFTDPFSPNAGRILVTASVSLSVQGIIDATLGYDQSALLTIPNGWTGFFISQTASYFRDSGTGRKAGVIDVSFTSPNLGKTTNFSYGMSTDGTSVIHEEFKIPTGLTGPLDIEFTVTSESNQSNCGVQTEFLLVKGAFGPTFFNIYEE